MRIFYHKRDLSDYLAQFRPQNKRIGLIPTMGALHQGHLSLVDYIKNHCDIIVCSIFVNPTQFNNAEDLEKYPRPMKEDLQLLENIGCDVVFMPAVDEMYGENESWSIDLGKLDQVLEGVFRPGHYQGVTQIVKKLFDIIRPDVVCFGQKDYQQFLVIEEMVKICSITTVLIMCPTVRESDGLAMSSRNIRLSPIGRKRALVINETLQELPDHCLRFGVIEARKIAVKKLSESDGVTLEYFEICNPETLEVLPFAQKGDQLVALVAIWLEGVRLIDNIIFILEG